MRILVLGGTVFVGWTVAAEALRRGHEVVCAARGEGGGVPDGAKLVKVDRNQPEALAPLAGERFDAVVDVATMSYPWVRDALKVLGPNADHWTFVSSVSTYADTSTMGLTTSGRLLPPLREGRDDGEFTPDRYGSIKRASEDEVLSVLGDRALIARAGLIVGPKDPHDRFGYWPNRFLRGGQVLVPDVDQLIQLIDVRDMAEWIIDSAERRATGVYDVVDTPRQLSELLGQIAEQLAPTGTELVPASHDRLVEADLTPWSGPRSLPLWLPKTHLGMCAHDVTATLAAGLKIRSLSESVEGALVTERELGLDRERHAGLAPAVEREVLALLQA